MGVQEVHVKRGNLSGSRARADSRTSCSPAVQFPYDRDAEGDIPESKRDNATPIFLLHNHVPTRNCMKSGVPPPRLLNSFAVSHKTRTCVLYHMLYLPRSQTLACAARRRMELSSYVIQRRVWRVAQLRVQCLLDTLECKTHVR